jgi:molybdopterin-guanine dinucleotide biosynthesis protein A
MMAAETLGLVLAGGLARRMGGGDKPLRLLGGSPLLDHVLARITPQVATVVLNANGDPGRFAAFGLPVVADPLPDHPGRSRAFWPVLNGRRRIGLTLPG